MDLYNWSAIPLEQLNPLISRKVVHTEGMTMARLWLKAGSVVPEHRHVNEQVCTVESGEVVFVMEGKEIPVRAGETLRIPPNVPHWVRVPEDAVALDLFTPPRADWIRGDDAYLRGSPTNG